VQRIGARVRVTGLAERTLAGAPVNIVEGGVVVARATIRPDGGFKVGVALPAKRGGRTLRYQAQLGALRSRNLRLRRRMITTAARLQRGRIVFSGRVVNGRRLRKGIIVRLDARPRGCGTRYVRIGQARLRPRRALRHQGRGAEGRRPRGLPGERQLAPQRADVQPAADDRPALRCSATGPEPQGAARRSPRGERE